MPPASFRSILTPESDMNMHAQISHMVTHTAAHHHIHTFIHFYKVVIAYLICLHICSLLSLTILIPTNHIIHIDFIGLLYIRSIPLSILFFKKITEKPEIPIFQGFPVLLFYFPICLRRISTKHKICTDKVMIQVIGYDRYTVVTV